MRVQPVATQPAERTADQLVRQLASKTLDPRSVTAAEERALLIWCRRRAAAAETKIAALAAAGCGRSARRQSEAYRRSLAARWIALHRSKPKELADQIDDTSATAAEKRASRLQLALTHLDAVGDFSTPAHGRVFVKRKGTPKDHRASRRTRFEQLEERRAIWSFGWCDKARQRLLARSLHPLAGFHPSQYLLRRGTEGRGRSAVCRDLCRWVPDLPEDHVFVQLDVRNFFGTICHAWLEANLELPRKTVRHHVHTGAMNVSLMRSAMTHLTADGARDELVRRGIPQGSALSSLVAEMVMANVLGGLADRLSPCSLITYSDNLGLFGPRREVAAVVDLLRAAFRAHAAGPFELTATDPMPVANGFQFLGYSWRIRGAKLTAEVPRAVAAARLISIQSDILHGGPRDLARARQRIEAQAAEWRFWPCVFAWKATATAFLRAAS